MGLLTLFAVLGFGGTAASGISDYQRLMWLSLVSLFFHQLEEYRVIGTFPGMINRVMFHSARPDRYPLNTNTAFIINVVIGWGLYFFAALGAEKVVWLGMASIVVSMGNIFAHTFVFNFKGRTLFNAGLVTSWLFFAPCIYFFFVIIHRDHLVQGSDYLIGIPLGLMINILGIIKLIGWMADKNTSFIFKDRQLLPRDRKK